MTADKLTQEDHDDPERNGTPPKPEDTPGTPGAKGGSDSPSADTPPGLPAKDSSPLGDTDQHSDA